MYPAQSVMPEGLEHAARQACECGMIARGYGQNGGNQFDADG